MLGHPFCIGDIKLIYKEAGNCIENLKYPAVYQSVEETNALYILSNTIAQIF